jgi:hypothetical protein
MSIFKKLFRKRGKKISTEEIKKLEEKDESVELPLSPPSPPGESKEGYSITGAFQTVQTMLDEAKAEKAKTRAAAKRVTDSIGVTPAPMPTKKVKK